VLWVIVFVAIALAGLIMVACYAVWLAHKTADVWSEVTVLTGRGAQLAELVGQIGPSLPGSAPNDLRGLVPADHEA
jgi:hypothetical protein